jgi:hypothetical protein
MSREEGFAGAGLIVALAAVFGLDLLFPLGVASGMFYVPLLFLCRPANGRRWLIPVASLATVLILLDLALGVGGALSPPWVYLTNRAGSISVLWAIAILLRRGFALERAHDEAVERAAAFAERRVLAGLLPICASCKRIQRSNEVWQSLEAYIQTHSEASFSHGLCPACMMSLYPELPPPQ